MKGRQFYLFWALKSMWYGIFGLHYVLSGIPASTRLCPLLFLVHFVSPNFAAFLSVASLTPMLLTHLWLQNLYIRLQHFCSCGSSPALLIQSSALEYKLKCFLFFSFCSYICPLVIYLFYTLWVLKILMRSFVTLSYLYWG